jgi:hypothetical protein
MSTIPLHSTLTQILEHPQETLTASEVAGILGVHRSGICEALNKGDLEGLQHNFRGYSTRQHWKITKSALVAWIWRHTTGDKAVLRAALAHHAPLLLRSLESPLPRLIPFPQTHKPNKRYVTTTHPNQMDLFGSDTDACTEADATHTAAVSGA